ncbi:hypothetical protein [Halopseudomonas sabulinigri]|uniref:Bro-N domain-containing protein n=1 Tax=Halopseudomonas sabulinigri TaxID=472181 RepID=A0ABP9ZQY9_9GAMM
MAVEQRLTLPQAVERLFGIPLARHAVLRNAVNTLVKAMSQAKMLHLAENEISHTNGGRKRWTLPERELTTLSNAIVLQGIFGEPKTVIRLFTHPKRRNEYADWAKSLLLERQSVANIGLINHEILRLLEQLASNADLKTERLPNPFDNTLPQMGLSEYGGNLLKTLACQTAALSTGDSMMAQYLNGELEQANDAACRLQTDNPLLLQYRQLIIRTYKEAKEFDALLDEWR